MVRRRPELKGAHTVDIAKLLVSKVLQAVRDAGPISAALQRTRDATMAKYRQATVSSTGTGRGTLRRPT